MKKRYYKVVATVTDGARVWDVVIYSHYESIEEAQAGIDRFASHGYNILKTWAALPRTPASYLAGALYLTSDYIKF